MGNKNGKPNKKSKPGKNLRKEQFKPEGKPSLSEQDLEFLTSHTGQSKADIKELFEQFMQNNPDGKLNKQEFISLYSKLRPEEPNALNQISAFVFRAFDTDKNGTIDFNEFLICYSLTSRGDLKKKLEYAFALYDRDNNGYLDKDELQEVLAGMLDLLGADKQSYNPTILAEQCMKELDRSNDGTISKSEFIEGMLRSYSLRTLLSPFN